jgi:hypothetical protein
VRIVGIDPGVNTGWAVWDTIGRKLVAVETIRIHEAILRLQADPPAMVIVEDARLRKWYGSADARQARSGAGIREGVGSVKRDCSILDDFLTSAGIPHRMQAPARSATKIPADRFAAMSGWVGRCSQHGRDAAMLVIGLSTVSPAAGANDGNV